MDTSTFHFYFWTFAALVAAGIGFPIPEELPVVTGGAMVGHPDNGLYWWIMLPICISGVVISDALLYGIGRWWGPSLLEYRWVKTRVLPPERRQRIEKNFDEYGVKILLFARFLPAIRSPIFITAGIMRVSFTRFLLADGLYAIPGVSLLFFLGYWFTDQFVAFIHKAEEKRALVILVILALVGAYLLFNFLRHPMTTGDPKEMPVIAQAAVKLEQKLESLAARSLPTQAGSQSKAPEQQPQAEDDRVKG